MTNASNIIIEYKDKHRLSYRDLAEQMNVVLASRPYPPRSITGMALHQWATGQTGRIDASRWEYIANHAANEDLKVLAENVYNALAQPALSPTPDPLAGRG